MFISAKRIKTVDENERNLIERLTRAIEIISEKLEYDFDIEFQTEEQNTIKYTDIHSSLVLNLYKNSKKHVTVRYVIPSYSSGVISLQGVKRFFQKQIRDTIFIPLSTQLKVVLGDLFIGIDETSSYPKIEAINIRLPLYFIYAYFCNKYDKPKIWDDYITQDQGEIYNQFILTKKKSPLSLMKKETAESKVNKIIKLLDIYYELYKDLIHEYADHIGDLLFKGYLLLGSKLEDKDGLALHHRKVRTQTDIIYDAYIYNTLFHLIGGSSRRKTAKKEIVIEPTSVIYDFVLMEQFSAPLASLSDVNRCTILGRGGFQRDSVPIGKRNIHPSHMYNLDPCVTPDRDNAGIVLYLATGVETDKHGRFINTLDKEQEVLTSLYDKKLEELSYTLDQNEDNE